MGKTLRRMVRWACCGGWLRDTDDGATTDVLTAVQRAVFGGVRLRIRYRTGTRPGAEPGPAAERVVDPVGLVQASGRWYLLALRDIAVGEEIFFDYGLVIEERHTPALKKRFECRCGAKNCRGSMLAPKRNQRAAKA